MEIIKVTPRGYCKGVVSAIEIAKKTRKQYPNEKITILGMLVHNQYVVDALKHYQIDTIDIPKKSRIELLDEVSDGIVIFTAHGVSDKVFEKAKEKGLIVVDATCLDVTKTEIAIKEHLQNGYEVFYIGKENHPEANAMLSICPSKIHLIPNETTANTIEIQANKLFLTNQTTMSMMEVQKWIDKGVDGIDNKCCIFEIAQHAHVDDGACCHTPLACHSMGRAPQYAPYYKVRHCNK